MTAKEGSWVDPSSVAVLPFEDTTCTCIKKMVSKHMKMVCILPRKISSFQRPVKVDLALKALVIYSIPCQREKIYIGQTGHFNETTVKKDHHHNLLYHLDESAVAENTLATRHC
jgi:hypothetical protein